MSLHIALLSVATLAETRKAAEDTPDRPRIGLVLSGGGALGFAHIGVLQVLHDLHVPVDCVVGTSMGALVGGVYASGVTPEDIRSHIANTDIESLFDDQPPRADISYRIKQDDSRPLFDFALGVNDDVNLPAGASAGYKFELFLKEVIGLESSVEMDFDDLPIPYRAIATDLETGDMKVFDHGELASVMRASMSLPAIVAPAVIDDRAYIDGGLVRNLPVDTGRELCADIVIAVNLGTSPLPKEEIENSLDVALQSIIILTEQNVNVSLKQLGTDDILITPELDGFTSSSFDSDAEIIDRGTAAARSVQDSLSRLSLSPDEYDQWLAARLSQRREPLVVRSITAKVVGDVEVTALRQDISEQAGFGFDLENLDRNLTEVYGRGDFSYVGYTVIPDGDEAEIVIEAETKPWGPGYLKFGLGAVTDFTSPTQLNVAASYRRTLLNSLGAVWRTDVQLGYDSQIRTEFFQPLQYRGGLFVAPYALARRNFIQAYFNEDRIGDVIVKHYQAGVDIGVTGALGEIRIGSFFARVSEEPDLGIFNALIDKSEVDQTGIELTGVIDQMDSLVFPRSGLQMSAELKAVEQSDTELESYTRARASITGAMSFDLGTVRANLEWGDEITNDEISGPGPSPLPLFDTFRLGGPLRLSGLYLDQLNSYHYRLAALSYYYQYASLPSKLGRGLYVGLSLEAGQSDDPLQDEPNTTITSSSVFWGADTVLGAMYIGYGKSSLNDQQTLYISIGPQF